MKRVHLTIAALAAFVVAALPIRSEALQKIQNLAVDTLNVIDVLKINGTTVFSGGATDVTYNSITGGDSSLDITGKTSGGTCSLTGGAGATNSAGGTSNQTGGAGNGSGNGGAATQTGGAAGATGTGGASSVTGGAATAGAGGAASVTGGAGGGTGTGGASAVAGGASGAGATGTGGAASLTGGASTATNGSGGAASVVGGVATGTGTGGAVAITSGASAGASGTAGSVAIDAGAAAGGTAGNITIGASNADYVRITSAVVRPEAATTLTAANPTLTKANLQAAQFWGVNTSSNAVAVAIGNDAAMDAADIGSVKTFTVTTGHATQALTVTVGASGITTVTTINTLGTTCEDAGDTIQCIIRTTAAATCITFCAD